ncbi:MAG TPA: hypothetical protein VMU50_10655 [Polyangia bacterium]|nr:hypothetical protein [Polyangia bacterium]
MFDLPSAVSLGGAVLSSPRVQPIFFPGFPYAADIDRFVTALSNSSYWTAIASEYGVGAISPLAGFVSTAMLPASAAISDVQTALGEALQAMGAANPPLPVRSDTIYALFFDPQTTLSFMGTTLCGAGQPSGFHDEWLFGNTPLPVVVIPTCATSDADTNLRGVEALTPSFSHELLEAATDPYVRSAPAFVTIDSRHSLWAEALNGGELADLCENEVPSLVVPGDIGYPVQRTWSNAGASAGTGPCVPVPAGEIYFNGQANLPDQAQLDIGTGTAVTVPTLNAAVGQAVSAQVSLRGVHNATASVGVLAIEIDNAGAVPSTHAKPVAAMLGQNVAVPVSQTATGKSGVTPLLIVAGSNSALHFWVGGINRTP